MFRTILGIVLIVGSYFWAIALGAGDLKTPIGLKASWFALILMVVFAALGETLTRIK